MLTEKEKMLMLLDHFIQHVHRQLKDDHYSRRYDNPYEFIKDQLKQFMKNIDLDEQSKDGFKKMTEDK